MIVLEAIYKSVTNAYADHHDIPRPFAASSPLAEVEAELLVLEAEARYAELCEARDYPSRQDTLDDPPPSHAWRNR